MVHELDDTIDDLVKNINDLKELEKAWIFHGDQSLLKLELIKKIKNFQEIFINNEDINKILNNIYDYKQNKIDINQLLHICHLDYNNELFDIFEENFKLCNDNNILLKILKIYEHFNNKLILTKNIKDIISKININIISQII